MARTIDMPKWINALEQARNSGVAECHSIHCRHYALGTGKPCVVEAARTIYARNTYQHEELVARGQVQPIAEEV